MVDMRELADLDTSMSMERTVEVLTKALDTIPHAEGRPLALSPEQGRLLDLVTQKVGEAEGYFDRPVDDPAIYQRLVAIGGAAGRTDLVQRFGRRTAEIEAAGLEFQARLQAFFGATSRAVTLFAKAVDLTPDFKEAVDGLDRAQRRVAKSERNLPKLADKARASRGSAKAWMDLGQALADVDRLAESLEALERAVGLAPTDTAAMCKRGGVLAALGRVEEAKECYEAALAIDGKSQNGKRGLNYTTYILDRS